jgi:hypothetical protein
MQRVRGEAVEQRERPEEHEVEEQEEPAREHVAEALAELEEGFHRDGEARAESKMRCPGRSQAPRRPAVPGFEGG